MHPGGGQVVSGKSGKNGKRPLTVRQKKFLIAKFNGKSTHAAALDAGYTPQTAKDAGNIIARPNVRAEFERLLEKYAPLEKVAKRVSEGLDAKETKFFQSEGKVTATRTVIAWGERRRYAELVGRFRNLISFEGQPPGPSAINLIFYGVQPPAWANPSQELLPES